jgi:hydroxymethylpyrimidine pyrophosphatase-like HAD family hydrolase
MRAGRPRLVAIDLDGTFLRSDGTIAPRSAAALTRIERAGARYVFITGRPPRFTAPTLGPFGHQGTVICSNGALTYDLRRGIVTGQRLIPAAALAEAAARLRRAIPGLGIAVESSSSRIRPDGDGPLGPSLRLRPAAARPQVTKTTRLTFLAPGSG